MKLVKSKIIPINTMKFDEFWGVMVIDLAEPKQFATQTKPFSAKYSGGRIMVSTSDTLWPIDRSTMRQIWTKAMSMHEKMRFIHTNYSHENIRTSSYIISLMKHYVADEAKME
ncbi:MAG: hypothetical protein ACREA8_11935 [Nitrosotalea sp.]